MLSEVSFALLKQPNGEFVLGKVPPEIEIDLRQTVVSLTKQIEELNLHHRFASYMDTNDVYIVHK